MVSSRIVFCVLVLIEVYNRDGYTNAATSKMVHFVIIVPGWKSLTIITKSSILEVAAVLDPSSQPTILRNYNVIIT